MMVWYDDQEGGVRLDLPAMAAFKRIGGIGWEIEHRIGTTTVVWPPQEVELSFDIKRAETGEGGTDIYLARSFVRCGCGL
jgi:hypothetical protein